MSGPLSSHLDIGEDLAEQARADRLSGMHRHDCPPTIWMLQKVVAAFDPDNQKTARFTAATTYFPRSLGSRGMIKS